MPQPTFSSLITPVYRRLEPADATTVCSQYDEEYRPAGGGDPRDHYPYPQLLDPGWVSRAALEPACVGWWPSSAGWWSARRLLCATSGLGDDRVAEVFGIVVRRAARGHRIGAGLLARLDAALGDDVAVVLCEARTGDERGWKVAELRVHAGRVRAVRTHDAGRLGSDAADDPRPRIGPLARLGGAAGECRRPRPGRDRAGP